MPGLSSIISRRWVSNSDSSATGLLRLGEGQRQGEGSPLASSGALALQRAAEILGRQRAAVQTKAVAVFARSEAVTEDALEILRRDAYAGIADSDQHRAIDRAHADSHALLAAPGLIASIFGVADHVHQDLQHFMLVDRDQRHVLEIA